MEDQLKNRSDSLPPLVARVFSVLLLLAPLQRQLPGVHFVRSPPQWRQIQRVWSDPDRPPCPRRWSPDSVPTTVFCVSGYHCLDLLSVSCYGELGTSAEGGSAVTLGVVKGA